jgi:hypothetical protein
MVYKRSAEYRGVILEVGIGDLLACKGECYVAIVDRARLRRFLTL